MKGNKDIHVHDNRDAGLLTAIPREEIVVAEIEPPVREEVSASTTARPVP